MGTWPDRMTARPLTQWPAGAPRATRHRNTPFDAPLTATLAALKTELRHLGGGQVASAVLQVDFAADQLRKDGLPYAGARAATPAVVLTINAPTGVLTFPADTFSTWEANLRAITLALHDLRRIARYGITRHDEQYAGWKALPGPAPEPRQCETPEDVEAAAWTLVVWSAPDRALLSRDQDAPLLVRDADVCEQAHDHARRRAHPDRGGSSDAWLDVETAGAVMRAWHEGRARG